MYRIDFFNGKGFVWVLVLLFILFNILLTRTMPADLVLDLRFLYTPEILFDSLSKMGESGREQYWKGIIYLDMPYILVYTYLFCRILKNLWSGSQLYYLTIGVAFADLFENLLMLYHIQTFPEISEFLGYLTSLFTSLKWIMVVSMFGLIIIGLVRRVFSKQLKAS
ncbi:hypothetical protein [Algoriphagus sediminis]|uniref:Uncharacterized protein n=1 Tax=Algoriphagus sediminis TaxID=3057113 RepID=A0ABT7Y7N9_9BACT|nr:hypothetical protein [Algoriphagus sediminis]MDN3202535.1 hypothetical protein [Algoriphagus sediminis]